jgi:hypothetical protein
VRRSKAEERSPRPGVGKREKALPTQDCNATQTDQNANYLAMEQLFLAERGHDDAAQ